MLQIISLVRKKNEKGMSVEEIAELLEVEDEQISNIVEILQSNPRASDEEVAQTILK